MQYTQIFLAAKIENLWKQKFDIVLIVPQA